MERIGLIAGGGKLPIIFAEEARKKGTKVIVFAVKDIADPRIAASSDRIHWLTAGEFKKFFLLLLVERIKKIAMLGKIDKSVIYSKIKRDKKTAELLEGVKDRNDYSLLERLTHELGKVGVTVISGVEYLDNLLPKRGVLTERQPTESETEDISFGLKTAEEIARMDIGQAVVIKNKAVVAIEAMEGTNKTIERAAGLCGEGFVVIKVPRPEQDMRWDVPVVGRETIELIARHKGKALAIKEKKMFLIEKEACINLADKNNLSIVVA